MLVCMGVGRNYSLGGSPVDFSKSFSAWAKRGEICFYHIGFQTNTNGTRAFMRNFHCGVEMVKRFVKVHLHCIIFNLNKEK